MKTRRRAQFHLPVAIAFTVVTGVHTVAAWAADVGTDTTGAGAGAGTGAGTGADAGGDASNSDAGQRTPPDCSGHAEARRSTTTLFGSGCC